MSSIGPAPQTYRTTKPVGAILFGLFSIILGAALTLAALSLAAQSQLWPYVALTGIGYVTCGIGFLQMQPWAWKASVLIYGASLAASVVQAFLRLFVWGIFFEPLVIVYLLIPRVRASFFPPSARSPVTPETEANRLEVSLPKVSPGRTGFQLRGRKSTILTSVGMIAILSVVPFVILFVHAVYVSGVTLDIVYTGNPSETWFGFSPKIVSGPMFTWGDARLAFRFSLTNVGLFQSHSINSISLETQGFVLYAPSPPITIPNFATLTLMLQLQTPDYNYNGPVTIQINTS